LDARSWDQEMQGAGADLAEELGLLVNLTRFEETVSRVSPMCHRVECLPSSPQVRIREQAVSLAVAAGNTNGVTEDSARTSKETHRGEDQDRQSARIYIMSLYAKAERKV